MSNRLLAYSDIFFGVSVQEQQEMLMGSIGLVGSVSGDRGKGQQYFNNNLEDLKI